MRNILFEAGVDPAVIDASAQYVTLTAATDVVLDALYIDQVWRACQAHAHRSQDRCTICVRRLADAAARITEAPLAGITMPESPEFDLWLTSRRTQIADCSRQILQALAMFHACLLYTSDAADE